MIDSFGTHQWRNPEGLLHRVGEDGVQDGPAIIHKSGYQVWYLDGQRHRLDGPAVTHSNSETMWFIEGMLLTQEQWARDPRVVEYNSRTQQGAEEWLRQM